MLLHAPQSSNMDDRQQDDFWICWRKANSFMHPGSEVGHSIQNSMSTDIAD